MPWREVDPKQWAAKNMSVQARKMSMPPPALVTLAFEQLRETGMIARVLAMKAVGCSDEKCSLQMIRT